MISKLFFTHFLAQAESSHLALGEVFRGSPIIYSVLGILSCISLALWFYTFSTITTKRLVPNDFVRQLREQLAEQRYEAALIACQNANSSFGSILTSALLSRHHGHEVVVEAIKTEGKRSGVSLWQRISLLNDIAALAPMLGLLGTVLGIFYAFYDVNRSFETLTSIFDGLGMAVGTTVAGLIVAILAMFFYTILKFRLIKVLNVMENEALSLGNLITRGEKG